MENNKEEKTEIKKIDKKRNETLKKIRDAKENITKMIGNIEIKKQEMMVQYLSLAKQMQKEAEAALMEIGIEQSSIEEYKINIETGECTK